MTDEHYYIGIDLGTTNSLIAWSNYLPLKSAHIPDVIGVEFMNRGGESTRSELLSSVVYFKEDTDPIVGEFARTQAFNTQPHRVVKSVKSKMGSNKTINIGPDRYSPAEVSALILKQLKAATLDKFGFLVDDVVIAVPASFDSNMRRNTIEAARLAGFKLTNSDGSPRDILIDEPRAALYCLIHQQQTGGIPQSSIDQSTTKTILIYDLGGGTLDISIYKIRVNMQTYELDQEEHIATSRYSLIGGDNFDDLIAKYFESEFEKKYGISVDEIPSENTRHEIRSRFLLVAEEKKKELNIQVDNGLRQGKDYDQAIRNAVTSVLLPGLYDKHIYSHPRFTWDELELIVKPLLAENLTIDDAYRLESIDESKSTNIIYPILNTLSKAYKDLGHMPKIDAVFLNGGMTRFHLVKQRLERFFGIRPITILDPDKSVALGASLYHLALHEGKIPASVPQAETIGIEIQGNIVRPLIPAGTPVPTIEPVVIDDFRIPRGSKEVTLAFYRGEGTTPDFPNVKLIEKVVGLDHVCQQSEPIHVEVSMDRNKILTFSGHLVSNPSIKIFAQVRDGVEYWTSSQDNDIQKVSKYQITVPDSSFLKRSLPEPTLPAVEVDSTIQSLFKDRAKDTLKKIIKRILAASNRDEFIQPFSERLSEATEEEMISRVKLYSRVIIALGKLASAHPSHPGVPDSFSTLLRVCSIQPLKESKNKKHLELINMAVVSLARVGNPAAEQALLDLLESPDGDSISYTVLAALTKISCTPNALGTCAKYLNAPSSGKRMHAALAIGKMSSDDRSKVISTGLATSIINQLLEQLQNENHIEVCSSLAYALCELANPGSAVRQGVQQDGLVKKITDMLQEKEKQLNRLRHRSTSYSTFKEIADMAIDVVNGVPLAEEQERVLLFMRSKLETIQDDDEKEEA